MPLLNAEAAFQCCAPCAGGATSERMISQGSNVQSTGHVPLVIRGPSSGARPSANVTVRAVHGYPWPQPPFAPPPPAAAAACLNGSDSECEPERHRAPVGPGPVGPGPGLEPLLSTGRRRLPAGDAPVGDHDASAPPRRPASAARLQAQVSGSGSGSSATVVSALPGPEALPASPAG